MSAPRRLHSALEAVRVLLRQPFQRTRPFTPAHQGGELLDVCQGLANGGESPVETGAFASDSAIHWNPPFSLVRLNLNC